MCGDVEFILARGRKSEYPISNSGWKFSCSNILRFPIRSASHIPLVTLFTFYLTGLETWNSLEITFFGKNRRGRTHRFLGLHKLTP